jgi:hypothetical protein
MFTGFTLRIHYIKVKGKVVLVPKAPYPKMYGGVLNLSPRCYLHTPAPLHLTPTGEKIGCYGKEKNPYSMHSHVLY